MKVFKLFDEGKAGYFFPVMFADGGGGAAAGETEGKSGDSSSAATDPGSEPGAAGASQGGSAGNDKPFATFPTEAAFMARLKQGSRAELRAMAEELGFESAEALKDAAKKAKEIAEQNKTELERAKDREQELEKENKRISEAANKRLINAELKVFATQSKFADPEDAVALASREGIEIDPETGAVTGVKEVIEALAKSKPHLLGKNAAPSVGGSSANPGGDADPGLTEAEKGKKLAADRIKSKAGNVDAALNPWASNDQ